MAGALRILEPTEFGVTLIARLLRTRSRATVHGDERSPLARRAIVGALVFISAASCRRLPPAVPTSGSDAALVEKFTRGLPYAPAILGIIRPSAVTSGRKAIDSYFDRLPERDQETIDRRLHDFIEHGRGGALHIVNALLERPMRDFPGWDRSRPILVALDGTEEDEDLSVLFRTMLRDPGEIVPRSLHHRFLVPAVDAHALAASIESVLMERGATQPLQNPDDRSILVLADSAIAAVSQEPDAVLVDVVSDEYPLARDEPARYRALRASLGQGRPGSVPADSFPDLAGSGGDALIIHIRPRALLRASLQSWLGAVGAIELLVDADDKRSLVAKGAADSLRSAVMMTPPAVVPSDSDLALGLSLVDSPVLRIGGVDALRELEDSALEKAAGFAVTRTKANARIRGHLPLLFDASAYVSLATKVGGQGLIDSELSSDLDACGLVCAAAILASHPVRALSVLAAIAGVAGPPVSFTASVDQRSNSVEARADSAACEQRVFRAMQKTFESLAIPAPDAEARYTASITALFASFNCWRPGTVPENVKRIRLAATLVEAERMVASLQKKDAIALLRDACRSGEAEACSRMQGLERLEHIPEVVLPSVNAKCALELPDPAAAILTVDARGSSGAISRANSIGGPIVVEADRDAPHAAVVSALAQFHPRFVALAIMRKGSTSLGLRTQGFDPIAGDSNPNIGTIRYSAARSEAFIEFPGQPTVKVKLNTSCLATGPCPLAVALEELKAKIGQVPPVVIEMAKGASWSETVKLVANAMCRGAGEELNEAAGNVMLLKPAKRQGPR